MPEKIKYPNFKEIEKKCKEKIKEKFPKYGNSWNDNFCIDWAWWEKRLQGETDEIFNTIYPTERRDEIIDAINILAMMYQNNKKFVEWHYEEMRMGRHG